MPNSEDPDEAAHNEPFGQLILEMIQLEQNISRSFVDSNFVLCFYGALMVKEILKSSANDNKSSA